MKCFKGLFTVAALGVTLGANAAMLEGDNVIFTFDDSTLFGATAIVSGDRLSFLPTDFTAQSSNGVGGIVTLEETINVTVTAKEGFTITGASMRERGDYFLFDLGGGVPGVGASGEFNVSSNDPADTDSSTGFSSGPLLNVTSLAGFSTSPWSATATADPFMATTAILQVQNILAAFSENPGDSGFIQKKLLRFNVTATPIPLPASFWLLLSGVGLTLARRRKAAA